MHSMSLHSPSLNNRPACSSCLCATFFLMFWSSCSSHLTTSDPTDDSLLHSLYSASDAARTEALIMQSLDAPHNPVMRILTNSLDSSYHQAMRISVADLQSRRVLEQNIQIAAFQQFGSQKTGRLYNVSVSTAPSAIVQAIRLRSGSFRRYGVTINEFIIPRGCQVNPTPERVLIVYTQLPNSTTLFRSLPEGYVLASHVLSVLVYDALNLNSSQPTQQLTVSTTANPITIQFAASSDLKCASFDENSTDVSYSDSVQGACQVNGSGVFALVSNAPVPAPSPVSAPIGVSPRLPSSRSNTWKVVVGSVVGGFALLVLVSLLALGIANRRKKAKFANMEYQAEHGETLQTTTIRNSRVPAAGSTRTQSMIEREYSA